MTHSAGAPLSAAHRRTRFRSPVCASPGSISACAFPPGSARLHYESVSMFWFDDSKPHEGGGEILADHLALAATVASRVVKHVIPRHLRIQQAEYLALRLLCENPGSAPSHLADVLGVSRPRATIVADGLARRGLLTREADARDRRSNRLYITATGEALARQMAGLRVLGDQRVGLELSTSERQLLIELLKKVERSVARPDPGTSAATSVDEMRR